VTDWSKTLKPSCIANIANFFPVSFRCLLEQTNTTMMMMMMMVIIIIIITII